jgi:hypothetical protein
MRGAHPTLAWRDATGRLPLGGAAGRARYMTLETIAPLRDDLALMLPTAAA